MTDTVPAARIRPLNARPLNTSGALVLYWMTAARRLRWNFGLQRSVDLSLQLRKPLVILEALEVDYPWASDRLHRFILDGMAANAREAASAGVAYHPYVEPEPGHGRGLIAALSAHACAVVTDHYPAFLIPRIARAAAEKSLTRFEAVDSNGLLPLALHGRAFSSARSFRAFVQRELRSHLQTFPEERPLSRLRSSIPLRGLPARVRNRWPAALATLLRHGGSLAHLPIDHHVRPVPLQGGSDSATERLNGFLEESLPRYADGHNHPDENCTSRLSPYLHFGHISAHEVFSALMSRERWTSRRLAPRGGGAREGWWGVGPSANLLLDQLVVWRELAFNGCEWIEGFFRAETLPAWALETLRDHADDERPRYQFEALDSAATQDEIWNAAQRQLVQEGWFHGYLRMLWGKKILEWAPDPQTALNWMEALMNRYSLDGRDPVSWASFTWVLGRYDRPWPRRPVYGTVRAMSSASTRRKLRMKRFLETYGDTAAARREPAQP